MIDPGCTHRAGSPAVVDRLVDGFVGPLAAVAGQVEAVGIDPAAELRRRCGGEAAVDGTDDDADGPGHGHAPRCRERPDAGRPS